MLPPSLQLKPDYAEALNNLGIVWLEQSKLEDAVTCFRRSLQLNPGYVKAHNNLGNALKEQSKLDNAISCYRRALRLDPNYADAHNNLGAVLKEQDKLDDAIACYRRALQLKPDYAEAHNNLGTAYQEQGNLADAVACYQTALALNPDFADAHFSLASAWLLSGDWQRGWSEYEWRWRMKGIAPRRFSQRLWDGAPFTGKTILLHAEQGLGDTMQFIRYASIVKSHGGTVIVECPKPLLPLLECCLGIDQLIGHGTDLPTFDFHSPLMSLPRILRTSVETIPAAIPYLVAKQELLELWRKRLNQFDGLKIGICWQGNPRYRGDGFRSMPLRYFAPLALIPGVRLISLQKGVGAEQLPEIRGRLFPVTDIATDLDEQSGAFMDTAALMKNLDLVITSDTAVAHLAGALGVPVWVALPFAADWRWLLDRSDSPWYPTMRLFRQSVRGAWSDVFERMAAALPVSIAASGRFQEK